MMLIRPAIAVVLVLTAVITLVAYPAMPDVVASHWNAAGELDGTMPKFWGLALIPLLMYGFCALLAVLPRIDPLRKNYLKFRDYYEGFILAFAAFLFFIQLQIILWGIGTQVSPNLTMPVMIGILFICIGFLMEHIEPNWFVGIRTPWTLSSENVWKKTHQKGATLFKLAGVVCFIGILAGIYAWLFIIVPVIAVAVYTVVYSYVEFRREQAAGEGE
jgi:immunity protein, SdpI family